MDKLSISTTVKLGQQVHYIIDSASNMDTWACSPTEVSIIGTSCLTVAFFFILDKSQLDLKAMPLKKKERLKNDASVYVCISFKPSSSSSSSQGHDDSNTTIAIMGCLAAKRQLDWLKPRRLGKNISLLNLFFMKE